MKLRRLAAKDSEKMLEWMKDPNINRFFRFDINSINEEQITNFINDSLRDETNLHLAIVNDADEYLGTVSLKNIDYKNGSAEYAISLRRNAIGTDLAQRATDTILYIAFFEMDLNKVYLNVLSQNVRAIRFYEKYGFAFEREYIEQVKIRGECQSLKWYGIINTVFFAKKLIHVDHIASQYEANILESKE